MLLPSLHYGVPVVARRFEKFDPEEAFALMARTQVRNTFIPPTALRMLRAAPNPQGRYDIRLRWIDSGGETLGAETLRMGQVRCLTINEFYGQTECNLVLSACNALGVSKAGAIGKPVPGHIVAVIDRQGNALKAGEIGQIAVKRPDPVMFLQYWGNPQATRDKFIGDWMTTGDQGVMDAEGYVSFIGRDDDVITSAGFRIGPGEIEECLIRHPAVALAAVVEAGCDAHRDREGLHRAQGETASDALASEIQSFVKRGCRATNIRGSLHRRHADDHDRQGDQAAAQGEGVGAPPMMNTWKPSGAGHPKSMINSATIAVEVASAAPSMPRRGISIAQSTRLMAKAMA